MGAWGARSHHMIAQRVYTQSRGWRPEKEPAEPINEEHPEGILYPRAEHLLMFIAAAKFQVFADADWDGFQGCRTMNPLIGTVRTVAGEYTIVIDGNEINLLHEKDGYGGQAYRLEEI